MSAITISRQLGSLGTRIACDVAERLGCRMVWRQVINEAARRAGAPEVALAAIDDLGLFDLRPSQRALQAYRQAVREVMADLLAEGDVVIVGRAGQVILADRPDVLHVRIVAPAEVRVERVAARQEISAAAARAQVQQSDRTRRNYLRQTYHVEWNDPQLYDLILNTARMTASSAGDLICHTLRTVLPCEEHE